MKHILYLFLLIPFLSYSQSEGGFGFRRFANTTALTNTSVNNSDKNASRRSYVHSTGLYYRWNGSSWVIEETIDTFSVNGTTLSLSILNDGIPAKTLSVANALATSGADSTFVKTSGSYLNKRITSNVYRGGTTGYQGLGGSGTDTTGVITISQGSSATKNSIYFEGNQRYIYEIETDSRGDSLSDWSVIRSFYDNASAVGDNQVVYTGFNVAPGGGKKVSSKSKMSIDLENKYTYDTDPYFEIHVPDILFKNSSAGRRPLSGLFGHEARFGGSWSFDADLILFNSYYSKTPKGWISFDSLSSNYDRGITFLDTSHIIMYKNNAGGYYQRNAANNAFVRALRVDNSDRVLLGGSNETRIAATNILQVTSGGYIYNENGDITIGNSTYSRSRLNIDAPGTEVLRMKTPTQTSPWKHLVYDDYYALNTPGGNALFYLHESGPNIMMTSDASGNIGLLTASPESRFHIKAANGATQSMLTFENSVEKVNSYLSNASPESAVTAIPGSFAYTEISSTGRWWGKQTGTGNTGWVEFYHTGNLPSDTNIYNTSSSFTSSRLATLDTTMEFALGRFITFPSTVVPTNNNAYGIHINGDGGFGNQGKRTEIYGSYYDRTQMGGITVGGGQFYSQTRSRPSSTSSNYNVSEIISYSAISSQESRLINTSYLENYNTIEIGQQRRFTGVPSDKKDYAYLFQGGDHITSGTQDTSALSMWLGYPQINDTTNTYSNKTRAVSKVRGWGVQSLFARNVNPYNIHPFNWINVSAGSVAADTLSNGIQFYSKYLWANESPSVTSGDTTIHVWIGTGSAATPDMISLDALVSASHNIYNSNGTTTQNTRQLTIRPGGTLTFIATDTVGGKFPFRLSVTGNEPEIQLWKGSTDSTYLKQSDTEYIFGSTAPLLVESQDYLIMQADSIQAQTIESVTKVHNLIGITEGTTIKQIEGTSTGQILIWDEPNNYWELGTASATVSDGDYGDITVSSSGTVWTIDAGVVSNSKIASGAGGIYKGSGTIPSTTAATVTATSSFKIKYDGGNDAFSANDGTNETYISGKDGTYSVSANNTDSRLSGALSSSLVLGSTGGTTLTASVANTNSVNTRETVVTNSSGTAATGLGSAKLWQLETSTTNSQDAAELDVVWSDGTHATRTGDFVFKTVASAASLTEAFRIGGTNYQLTATASVSNTNTLADRLVIKTNSSGTAAASFGGRLLFQNETSTTDNQDCAYISGYWGTATHASRQAKIGFGLVSNAGAITEHANFTMSGTNVITFNLGSSSTLAISQASFTTGTSYTVGNSAQSLTLGGSSGSVTMFNTSASSGAIQISNTSNTATSTGNIVFGNGTGLTQTSGTRNYLNINPSFAPTSGTAVHNNLVFDGTFNQTGGANGITRNIYLNPTLTAVADFRGIDIAYSNSSAKGIYQTGANTTNNFVGATGFGATTTPTDKLEVTGNISLLVAGNKLKIATGSNASAGTTGAMTAGTITVNTTAVTANSIILLTNAVAGGTPGTLMVGTITAGTSFVINSTSVFDTSTVNWLIIN